MRNCTLLNRLLTLNGSQVGGEGKGDLSLAVLSGLRILSPPPDFGKLCGPYFGFGLQPPASRPADTGCEPSTIFGISASWTGPAKL